MLTKTETPEQRFAMECVLSGCPQDQIENFLRAGYVPTPKQLKFHAACREADGDAGPTKIGFGGRRGPGKTHASFAQVALDDCQRFDGLKFLFLRKVAKAARESFEDLRRTVLHVTKHSYKAHRGLVEFPNSSRIVLGHFNSDRDIDAYIGIEYDGIAIEEANTLSGGKITRLLGSLRTSKPGWRPRAYMTFNPGGVGHGNIKRMFIVSWRDENEAETRFVSAGVYDNPFVHDSYRTYLESLTGWLRRAWLDGDWDIAAGQFFVTWRRDVHVQDFDLPGNLTYWVAMDYGFTHWNVVYLFAELEGCIYVVDEYAQRFTLVPEHAANIRDMLARHGLSVNDLTDFVAGADVFARRGETELTIAQQYETYGIELTTAVTNRVAGAAEILRRLGNIDAGMKPTVKIHPRCQRLIECLPTLEHDPRRPEDVLKIDTDDEGRGGDDFYDAFRYGIMAYGSSSGDGYGRNPMSGYRG